MRDCPTRRGFLSHAAAATAGTLFTASLLAQQQRPIDPGPGPAGLQLPDPAAGKKKLLAIGDVHTAYHHDSVSHALATIERLGRASGEFVTYIHTDTQMITKDPIWGKGKYGPDGTRPTNGKNLNDFDAIFFYGLGEEELSDKQKTDLLSFVHDDGKGYVGAHSAIDAFFSWPQYSEMMGAEFDNHPWGIIDAHIIVEEPGFPGMDAFPARFAFTDEIYVAKVAPYSRAGVDVLARCDPAFLDLAAPTVHRTDRDFPVAWVKPYGKGRVFYSTFGHADSAWDDTRIQSMYMGALRWALGLRPYTPRPHPMGA